MVTGRSSPPRAIGNAILRPWPARELTKTASLVKSRVIASASIPSACRPHTSGHGFGAVNRSSSESRCAPQVYETWFKTSKIPVLPNLDYHESGRKSRCALTGPKAPMVFRSRAVFASFSKDEKRLDTAVGQAKPYCCGKTIIQRCHFGVARRSRDRPRLFRFHFWLSPTTHFLPSRHRANFGTYDTINRFSIQTIYVRPTAARRCIASMIHASPKYSVMISWFPLLFPSINTFSLIS